MYDAVELAVDLSNRTSCSSEHKSNSPGVLESTERSLIQVANFPDDSSLIYAIPPSRTKHGNFRLAPMMYVIEGQVYRRVRLTRPWAKQNSLLNTPQVTVGQAQKLTRNRLNRMLQKRGRVFGFKKMLYKIQRGLEGPTAAFFTE